MPTYGYRCDTCGHAEDAERPVSDRNLLWLCPQDDYGCGQMHRVYNAPGIHYRAPGFYTTRDDPGGNHWSRKQRRKETR